MVDVDDWFSSSVDLAVYPGCENIELCLIFHGLKILLLLLSSGMSRSTVELSSMLILGPAF